MPGMFVANVTQVKVSNKMTLDRSVGSGRCFLVLRSSQPQGAAHAHNSAQGGSVQGRNKFRGCGDGHPACNNAIPDNDVHQPSRLENSLIHSL